jgi:hypothetical protein
MKTVYVLEAWRWNGDYNDSVKFTSLIEVHKAMTELSRSEGRTLAFVHKQTDAGSQVIASRDWYANASWKPITSEDYRELIFIISEYSAYNMMNEQRQAA